LGSHPCCQTLPNHHNYMSFKIPWKQISSSNIHASQSGRDICTSLHDHQVAC
jgi:predicted phosphatase